MKLVASDYAPPRWLRSPHVQSLLGSSPMRRRLGARALRDSGARSAEHLIDAGEGIRLHGVHSVPANAEPSALALLLHGWEGSAESSYMRLTAARLVDAGAAVFRLNFRDHGDSHHLNEGLFHSNRLDEVIDAALDVQRRFGEGLPLLLAGYSLGGNFALRVALHGPARGLRLQRVAAVCPLLDPAGTMDAMEQGLPLYLRYFERKWTSSLRRKFALFPPARFDDATLKLGMRELTAWLVERHTGFDSLDAYFDGYSIAGERMAGLSVPAEILMAEDDPVIPIADFHRWRLPPTARLELARHGGHCGFLLDARLHGHAERWIARRLLRPDGTLD